MRDNLEFIGLVTRLREILGFLILFPFLSFGGGMYVCILMDMDRIYYTTSHQQEKDRERTLYVLSLKEKRKEKTYPTYARLQTIKQPRLTLLDSKVVD